MNNIVYVGKHQLTYCVSRHSHLTMEIIYCTSGNGDFVFPDETIHYETGNVVVIPPHMVHTNASTSGFTNIHINMAEPTLNVQKPFMIKDDNNRFMLNAFTAAFYHYSGQSSQRSSLLSSYGDLIISYLIDDREAPMRSPIVSEIEKSIINNYPSPQFALDEYLHSLPFNYDYLRRLFKKETGVTPHKYLMDLRLTSAASWIGSAGTGNSSMTEISLQCGFRDPLYFSRMFRNRFGVSPKKYLGKLNRTPDFPLMDPDSIKIPVT